MVVKVNVGKVASIELFTLLIFCLASTMFALVRCQPNSIEKDIEVDCKWKGAPVSANLKWTEPKEDPVTLTNADNGSKSKSGTTSSQASTALNTQQALMLTGAASGAALAGGGLLVKKKLEGSSSSEQEAKQTTSTTSPKYRAGLELNQNELKSPSQGQSSAQTQQSSIQNPPKDGGLTPTASTLRASGATITKDLLMQKQVDSLTNQSQAPKQSQPEVRKPEPEVATTTLTSSTAIITKELLMQKQMDSQTKQPKQETAPPTSPNLGLLASSSSSAAQIATAMWPQRQKEFEKLAKQRADLAAKFSIPSYTGTGLGLASSMTNAADNTWDRLQGFGSALGNGLTNIGAAIKPYSKYIVPIVTAAIVVASIFLLPPAAPAFAGVGMGISISQGVSLVGAGILAGGIMFYAMHNTIVNYPQQPGFGTEHTQIIGQSTSEIKDEKGSGTYGEDVAQEQLEQANIAKDSIIQGPKHEKSRDQALTWLDEQDEPILSQNSAELDPEIPGKSIAKYGNPDIITEHYIVECKLGEKYELTDAEIQKDRYIQLAERVGKRLLYWFLKRPEPNSGWWKIIHELEECGWLVEYGDG